MKLCIIGGSTAGWWAAGYIEKHLPDWEITLYESPKVPPLGVGESCLPQLRWWWEDLGIKEKDWMTKANAVYKLGNYKEGWNNPDPTIDVPKITRFWGNDHHFFEKIVEDPNNYLPQHRYLTDKHKYIIKEKVIDILDNPSNWWDYAYHVCAEEGANIVKNICTRTIHKMDHLDKLPDGYDLYLDCTGLNRRFVKDHTPMKISPYHFVDRAWVQPQQKDPLLDYDVTKSTARNYGWEFEINLANRVGHGYVHSSRHVSPEKALDEFQANLKAQGRKPYPGTEPRLLQWEPKVLQNPWSDNVIAIGAASGFVDPLEATSLYTVQAGITQFVRTIKRGYRPEAFNAVMRRVFNDGLRFIIAHYTHSPRRDTQFWIDSGEGKEYHKNLFWNSYERYPGWRNWIFNNAIWADLAIYMNQMDGYQPHSSYRRNYDKVGRGNPKYDIV